MSPIDKLRLDLQESWTSGANIENIHDRKMFVGLCRLLEKDIDFLPHQDIFHLDSINNFRAKTLKSQIEANIYLDIDTTVNLALDADYRQQCRCSHSAGHLIADVLENTPAFSTYQPQATNGNHFPGAELVNHPPADTVSFCEDINHYLTNLIHADLPVSISTKDNNRRHIAIGKSARMCGGTHVNASGDLKGAQVTKVKSGKPNDGQTELTLFYTC